jgi:hypothetical protein
VEAVVFVDYPRIKQSLGIAALRDAYPTLFLDPSGIIHGVNPLAQWLWGALQEGEPFHPERLLEIHAFTKVAQQLHRIPVEQNREFYIKRSAIARRQDEHSQRTTYASFIAAMQADPARSALYESAPLYPDQEWEYPLTIAHPSQPGTMLTFQTSIYRLEENGGFLVVYYPVKETVPIIEEQNSKLINRLGKVISVQAEKQKQAEPDKILDDTGYHMFYRDYYPRIIQDPLWYLCGENKAHRLMMNMSVVGMHFFELFLAPLVHHFLGAIHDSTAPRALKYFDTFTTPYMREEHDLHEQYLQTIERLSQLEEFSPLLERLHNWTMHLNPIAQVNLDAGSDEPFYTCRVVLPWRFDPDVHLQFKSMVRFLFDTGIAPQADRRNYEVTLVPENYETDVAMLLLPLLDAPPENIEDANASRQFLWLLALLRVVEEAMGTSDEDVNWGPEESFARIYSELIARQEHAEDKMVLTEIRVTLEWLERKGKVGKANLLTLLRSAMLTQRHFKPLTDFLEQELASVKEMSV